MIGFFNKLIQSLLPHHFLCRMMYAITRIQQPQVKNFLIKRFMALYQLDMSRYARTKADDFIHFNDFFTRELAKLPNLDHTNTIYSPVDGFISEFGTIKHDTLIQAKNIDYRLDDLLTTNIDSQAYLDGKFITLYLSPSNYHRIHQAFDAKLMSMVYVPGRLFGVGRLTTQTMKGLYVKNERLIFHFDSTHGKFALIMIGAIFVGSMETVWSGMITPNKDRRLRRWDYSEDEIQHYQAGEELSRFNMGSTVIMLFEKDFIEWLDLQPQQAVYMGTPLAQCLDT